jgi:hypothetical protein
MGRRQPLLLLSSDPPPASWSIAPSNIIILFARSVDANNPKQLRRWVDFSTVKTRFMGLGCRSLTVSFIICSTQRFSDHYRAAQKIKSAGKTKEKAINDRKHEGAEGTL